MRLSSNSRVTTTSTISRVPLLVPIFIFLHLLNSAQGLSLNLCATDNLGTFNGNFKFNSNGKCFDNCNDEGYSVAILQGLDCWCSNSVPGDTVDMSNCAVPCPGYLSDSCATSGFFGYIIFGTPSATVFSSSSTSTSSTSSSPTSTSLTPPTSTENDEPASTEEPASTPISTKITLSTGTTMVTQTTQVTQTMEQSSTNSPESSVEAAHSSVPPSSSSPSSSSSSSSSSSLSSDSSSVHVSLHETTVYSFKTVNGTAQQTVMTQTLYVTPTPTPAPRSSSGSSSPTEHSLSGGLDGQSSAAGHKGSSFFDSKGKVAGTFTAVGLVVVGLILGILYFCCCLGGGRDTDSNYTDEENQISSDELSYNNEKTVPASFTTPKSLSSPSSPLKRDNSGKSLMSFFNGGAASEVARSSSKKNLMSDSIDFENSLSKEPMFPISEMDSRLDPRTMFMNKNLSIKSLDDDRDYSRKILKITNPE